MRSPPRGSEPWTGTSVFLDPDPDPKASARMQAALLLAAAAADSGVDIVDLEATYAKIGNTLGLSWLYATIPVTAADPHWAQPAKPAFRDELATLTVAVGGRRAQGRWRAWTREHRDAIERARTAYGGLAGNAEADVAMLTVGVQVLSDLCHALGAPWTPHPSVAGTPML